jgi:hypothetical protein
MKTYAYLYRVDFFLKMRNFSRKILEKNVVLCSPNEAEHRHQKS